MGLSKCKTKKKRPKRVKNIILAICSYLTGKNNYIWEKNTSRIVTENDIFL